MTVNPRPASTVVLIDHRSKVYLTKRPKTMKFFGGYYVFPGGAVETGDYVAGEQFRQLHSDFEPAYLIAAARELFEEVGVLLGSKNPASFQIDTECNYRRKLVNGELDFIQMLNQEKFFLNLESLQYFGNLITPEDKPIRFDTRFFLAKLPQGQSPKPDFHEIDDASWFLPQEAMEAYRQKEILLAPPTILALETIEKYLSGQPLIMPELKL
jgi:8-oxo-dGTP pyrophosphatase MutT (NUDIX family)